MQDTISMLPEHDAPAWGGSTNVAPTATPVMQGLGKRPPPALSIVATLYRSAPYLAEFHRRASEAARRLVGEDYELVLVNDGSPDDSLGIAIDLARQDSKVVVVDLSRNYGHHKAMMTGLEYARGERVFLLDSDLEEEPEWLATFAAEMQSRQVDVVFGQQESRKGGWFERWSGRATYAIYNWLCNVDHPEDVVTARLMTRRYVDALLQYRERELVISFLWVHAGFEQVGVRVRKHMTSETTYNLRRKVEHLVNAVTSFSEVPLRGIFYIGAAIFAGAMLYAARLAFDRILYDRIADGWTSVMVSIWVLGGLTISFVGVIGIYLSKVFSETKQRPYTIVREVYGRDGATSLHGTRRS